MSRRASRNSRRSRPKYALPPYTDSLLSGPVRAYRGDVTDTATNFDWTDRTGNGGTLRQATAADKPTIVTPSETNGQAAILFDGTSDFLAAIDAASNYVFMINGSPMELWTLLTPRGALTAGESVIDLYTSGANTAFRLLFGGTASSARVSVLDNAGAFAFDANATSSFAVDTPVLLRIAVDDGNSPEYAVYRDGTLAASGPATFGTNNPAAPLNVGRRPNGTAFGSFDMSELLIFDRLLSPAEAARLSGYFSVRY